MNLDTPSLTLLGYNQVLNKYLPQGTEHSWGEIHPFYPDLDDDARKVKRYEAKQNKQSGLGKQKIEGPRMNPLRSNNNTQSQGWVNTDSPVPEVRFTKEQSIKKRQTMSMEAAFQNEVSIKLGDLEERVNMSQAAAMRSMHEEVERLQTKLQAEMDSKIDSKLEVMLAPIQTQYQNLEAKSDAQAIGIAQIMNGVQHLIQYQQTQQQVSQRHHQVHTQLDQDLT